MSQPKRSGEHPSEDPTAFDGDERRRAYAALRESEQRYRRLFERNVAGVVRSTFDGRILDCNDALARMLGYESASQLRSRSAQDLYADPSARDELVSALQVAGEVRNFEVTLLRLDGEEILVLANLSLAVGNNEVIEGTVIDITDLRRLEARLRQAQKMEAVGQLAGGVAHDFNNLLTSILGYTELALQKLRTEDPLHAYLTEARGAGERAASLTRQLLAFSRKQVLEPRPLDLNQVVAAFEELLRRTIGEDIELVTTLASDLGIVQADPGQVDQVLMNLAVNARDAMPGGGRLVIETANFESSVPYERGGVVIGPGRYVTVTVADTGHGMDQRTCDRIFEPFFTTKEPGKGIGLGLATVYGIVQQSGGYLWVFSEPGMGTAFTIYLPRIDEVPRGARPHRGTDPCLGGTETILVVEDDRRVRRLTETVLRTRGYQVLTAAAPDEALQLVEQHGLFPDLLLTDLVMPGRTGLELAKLVVARRPQTRVLMMSGYPRSTHLHEDRFASNVLFMSKPYSLSDLACKVREALDRELDG